jgi:glycosyltransferase involved in cell wall biosynthesis
MRKELHITAEDFIVSYLGSIGGWYMTDEMLRFCSMLLQRKPTTRLLFISPHRHEEIVLAALKHGIPADRLITRKANRYEVPLLLSFSNYSLFFIKPCYSKLSSSPTKHGEIMAMGIPVITNSGVGDVKSIVEKHNSGFILNEFSDDAYNNIIAQIVQEKSFSPTRIRDGAIEYYSLNKAVETYSSVYKKIFCKEK